LRFFNPKGRAFINFDNQASPSTPSREVIEENFIFLLKTSYDSSIMCKLKSMNSMDWTDSKTKLFEFYQKYTG